MSFGQYPDAYEQQAEFARQAGGDQGPARLLPTQPAGAAPSGAVKVALPPENFAPAGAFAVDELGDANIAPAGAAFLVTVDVPPGMQLRLDGIGFGADDEVALRFLTWDVLVNTAPAQAYNGVAAIVGTIVQTAAIFLHVRGPARVQLRATAAAAAVLTYRYIARLKGWLYIEREGAS